MNRHRTNTEVVWRTISDFQKDPYTTGLSIFSKITDKILFRWVLLPDIMKRASIPMNKSYFQPCRGTTAGGRDGRTSSGAKQHRLIFADLAFSLGCSWKGLTFRNCMSIWRKTQFWMRYCSALPAVGHASLLSLAGGINKIQVPPPNPLWVGQEEPNWAAECLTISSMHQPIEKDLNVAHCTTLRCIS